MATYQESKFILLASCALLTVTCAKVLAVIQQPGTLALRLAAPALVVLGTTSVLDCQWFKLEKRVARFPVRAALFLPCFVVPLCIAGVMTWQFAAARPGWAALYGAGNLLFLLLALGVTRFRPSLSR